MKRIIFLLALCASFAVSHAQSTFTMTAQKANGTNVTYDTTVNADTSYLVSLSPLTGYYDVNLHWSNTQLTGSSGGSVIVQGSMVGGTTASDWYTLKNSWTQIYSGAVGLSDTTTISGTTKSEFKIVNNNWKYIRLRYISSGTQTSLLLGTMYIRKTNGQ